jgi:hypothetical protein
MRRMPCRHANPHAQYEALHACMDKNKDVFESLLAEMKAEEEARGLSSEGGGSGSSGEGAGAAAAAAAAAAAEGAASGGSDGSGSGGSGAQQDAAAAKQ